MARKRERINSPGGARFVRRDSKGRFDEVEDVGRSLSQDRKRKAKHVAKPGQGDRGDRKVSAGGTGRAGSAGKSMRSGSSKSSGSTGKSRKAR
jgi:hypothetical protein